MTNNLQLDELIKVYEDFYVNPSISPIQTIAICDYRIRCQGDEKRKKYWLIRITYFKKDSKGEFIGHSISPVAKTPQLLYEQLEVMGNRLNMVKISPMLYINNNLKIQNLYIVDYLGKFPNIIGKYIINIDFDTGHGEIVTDLFDDYESAHSYLKTLMIS